MYVLKYSSDTRSRLIIAYVFFSRRSFFFRAHAMALRDQRELLWTNASFMKKKKHVYIYIVYHTGPAMTLHYLHSWRRRDRRIVRYIAVTGRYCIYRATTIMERAERGLYPGDYRIDTGYIIFIGHFLRDTAGRV